MIELPHAQPPTGPSGSGKRPFAPPEVTWRGTVESATNQGFGGSLTPDNPYDPRFFPVPDP